MVHTVHFKDVSTSVSTYTHTYSYAYIYTYILTYIKLPTFYTFCTCKIIVAASVAMVVVFV